MKMSGIIQAGTFAFLAISRLYYTPLYVFPIAQATIHFTIRLNSYTFSFPLHHSRFDGGSLPF